MSTGTLHIPIPGQAPWPVVSLWLPTFISWFHALPPPPQAFTVSSITWGRRHCNSSRLTVLPVHHTCVFSAFCESSKSKAYNPVVILSPVSRTEELKCSYLASVCGLSVCCFASVGQHICFILCYRLQAGYFSSYLIK